MNGLRKNLRAMTADGAAASVMVGTGENYFPAFVLAISGSQVACGLTASVPLVIGAALQFAAPAGLRLIGSYRKWLLGCTLIQAASFLPLLGAALEGAMPVAALFAVIALYWGCGLAGGAAWNTWVGTLVPERCRARYFAWRTRVGQAATVIGFVGGGIALQWSASSGQQLVVFAALFLIAAGGRLIGSFFLSTQSEPLRPSPNVGLPSPQELRQFLCADGVGRVFAYLLAVQAAVQISGPYFTPYMLKQLEFSYGQYAVLIFAAFAAKIACLPTMGRIAERFGTNKLLWAGGLGIIPCSALWLVSDSFVYLILLQMAVGVAWGAYELASLLLAFEAIPREKRVGLLTLYNFANAAAFFLGSMLGGLLLSVLGEVRQTYLLLFVISSSARALAMLLLVGMPQLRLETITEAVHRAALGSLRSATARRLLGPPLPGPHWRLAPEDPEPIEEGEVQPWSAEETVSPAKGRPSATIGSMRVTGSDRFVHGSRP